MAMLKSLFFWGTVACILPGAQLLSVRAPVGAQASLAAVAGGEYEEILQRVGIPKVGKCDKRPKFQTEYLYNTFYKNKTAPGSVIELGSLNGFGHSYFFGELMNWRNIQIEANPQEEEAIKHNAPHAEVHMNAVCADRRTVLYQRTNLPGLSGIGPLNEEKLKLWGGSDGHAYVVQNYSVQCVPMTDILSEAPYVDLFVLDVEGFELEVLHTMDFSKTNVGVFMIENGMPETPVGEFMRAQGFVYHGEIGRWVHTRWIPTADHVWTRPDYVREYTNQRPAGCTRTDFCKTRPPANQAVVAT